MPEALRKEVDRMRDCTLSEGWRPCAGRADVSDSAGAGSGPGSSSTGGLPFEAPASALSAVGPSGGAGFSSGIASAASFFSVLATPCFPLPFFFSCSTYRPGCQRRLDDARAIWLTLFLAAASFSAFSLSASAMAQPLGKAM